MSDIRRYLDGQLQEMLNTLRELVELESPSRDKRLTDRLGAHLAELFEKLTGGTALVIDNEPFGNHIRGEWGEGPEQILLLAHLDTIWQEGDLADMPFRIEEDRVYGPGVFDMKGGIVQGLYALRALRELDKPLAAKVVFLCTSDEEIGSLSSRPLIEEEARKSRYVLVLEPAMGPQGALKTSRKGMGLFHLEVQGVSSHAGVDHRNGRSAIEELAHQIIALHSMTDYEQGTTVNVGIISGGTASNVVADKAEAEIDLRIASRSEADQVVPLIKALVPQTEGTTVKVEGGINRYPLERTARVAEMFEIARSIAKEELGLDLSEAGTGGGSDGNFTAPLAPTLDGLGAVGDGAHAKHEHLILSQMPVRSALLAHLLAKLDERIAGRTVPE
ncbi:M20 family metallopeptidase [Paenibacillus hodogayensis]|uniref:M20 family metallopeptidase n=1 Tax=Paenibacillus hodogayensis TaxID=279208 RepID=A0ABV5VYH4_9BACL